MLVSVINKHLANKNELAVNVVMDVIAYKSLLEPILAEKYKNPYLWCFHGILISCASWGAGNCTRRKDRKLKGVFGSFPAGS
jgi:hypothetical protein